MVPHDAPPTLGPNMRRMSRLEQRPILFGGRRMSTMSRTSVSGTSHGTGNKNAMGMLIPIKLQNTFKLEPELGDVFNASQVEKVIKGILESYLKGEKYDKKMCSSLVQNLSEIIRDRVKELVSARYKVVCCVLIGQNANQAVQSASRCLWSAETDKSASATFQKGDLFATATVYAMYFE